MDIQTIDPELIKDRKVIWRQYVNCAQDLRDWMTLMALDDLNNWSTVIVNEMNDMECDERSCQACVALVRKGKRGYAETCKVLSHLIKDRDLDLKI